MIRRVQLNIGYSNQFKLETLNSIFKEYKKTLNEVIDLEWKDGNFKSKFSLKKVSTWLSARMQQCLGKQALEIVKSQRKKKNKTKPTFDKDIINLDQRFLDIRFDDSGKFDIWIKLTSIGNSVKLYLPSKKHKHLLKFLNDPSWNIKKSARLRKEGENYFIDLYFEKEAPELKTEGGEIGLDCGYKKLLIDSNGRIYDEGLEAVYEKISRKKQGSKKFYKALRDRDNKINLSVKSIDLSSIKAVVVEDLKNVKKNTRKEKRISKKFNNKLQRWSYSKVLERLSRICEELGVDFIKVNPAHTSQTCSKCGFKDKKNRSSERFRCLSCGYIADADFNAAVNILHRGAYSPSTTQ